MKIALTLAATLFTAVCGCHAQENVYLGNYQKAYFHTRKGKETTVKQRMAFEKELAGRLGEYMTESGRLIDSRKYDDAIERYSRVITDGRDTVVFGEIGNKAVQCLAWAYLKSGQRDRCKAILRYENKLPYRLWLYPTPETNGTQSELIAWDAYDKLLAQIEKEHKHPEVYIKKYVTKKLPAGMVDGKKQYQDYTQMEAQETIYAHLTRYPEEKRVEAALLLSYFRYGEKFPAEKYLKSDAPEVKAALYCADYVNNRYGYYTQRGDSGEETTKAQAARLRLEAMGMFDARKIFAGWPDILPLICYDWAAKIVENKETADYPLAAAYLETCIEKSPGMASDNAVLTTRARLLLAQGYYKDALNTLVLIDGDVDGDILAARQGHLRKLKEWGVSEAEAESNISNGGSWRTYYNRMDRNKALSDAQARKQRQQREEQRYIGEAKNYDLYVEKAREFNVNGDLYNADQYAAKALYVGESSEMYNIRIRYILEGKMKIAELSENDQWNYKGGYDAELEQVRGFCNASLRLDSSATNRAHWYKGLCCGLLGYNNEAIASYSTYLTEYPQEPAAYYNRGLCYFELKNTGAALADFKRAREFFNDPKYKDRCLRMIDKCMK